MNSRGWNRIYLLNPDLFYHIIYPVPSFPSDLYSGFIRTSFGYPDIINLDETNNPVLLFPVLHLYNTKV